MGLWEKVGNEDILKQIAKKKEEMAKKMAHVSKEYSPSGQRHEFDRNFRKLGKATRFSKGYQPKH